MDNKVKELVRWARLTNGEKNGLWKEYIKIDPNKAIPWSDYVAEAQLHKAYSHPDLALIDKEKMPKYLPIKETYCRDNGWLPVIPLAEALKEG